jgi:hypothetical protein
LALQQDCSDEDQQRTWYEPVTYSELTRRSFLGGLQELCEL